MPTGQARFSPAALTDVREIVNHSRVRWGVEQADRYRRAIDATCVRLGSFPELGVELADLGAVRVFPVEQHRILYRVEADGVFILRIVHQRMSFERLELS